jgi:XTP/dITP diphosphohydrolase
MKSSNSKNQSILWKLNTSNKGKLEEFQRLFAKHGVALTSTQIDLNEVVADPLTVITHKASQLEPYILVEDTSLDIEGAAVGINVRWLLDNLQDFVGHKASWCVLLAYRSNDQITVFKGEVQGTIVASRGIQGFGFDPVFLPNGSSRTLAESKPDEVNARALAVEALIKNDVFATTKAIYEWDGEWQ